MDARNRRVGRKQGSTLDFRYLYEDQLRIAAQMTGAGVIQKEFVYGTSTNSPDYMIKTGVNYRIIKDHLGSVRLVVNATDGSIQQQMDYNDLGEVIADTSPNYQPFAFAGGLYDQSSKLVKFGARDYDPRSTGRWTAKDPILFDAGDTNLFGYAAQDPVNWIDEDGLTKNRPGQTTTNDGLSGGGGPSTIPAGSTVHVAPNGQAAVAPRGSTAGPTNNGAELRIVPPGSKAGGGNIRLMDPTRQYPNGYGRIQNSSGNYTDRFGNPVGKNDPSGHICP